MALTELQRRLCRLIAERLRASGASYVTGGVALNEALATPRVSRDLDIFNDSLEALRIAALEDRRAFELDGLVVEPHREDEAFVEVVVRDERGDTVVVEWAEDSDFRFFPLVPDDTLGVTLHPLDLATNKLRALTTRREVRDWLDVISSHERLQPLGYLAWALHGKDVGLSPLLTLDLVSRRAHFTRADVERLVFEGAPPDYASMGRTWRDALDEAHEIVGALPPHASEKCVLDAAGRPFRGGIDELRSALSRGELVFHAGTRGGTPPALTRRAEPG